MTLASATLWLLVGAAGWWSLTATAAPSPAAGPTEKAAHGTDDGPEAVKTSHSGKQLNAKWEMPKVSIGTLTVETFASQVMTADKAIMPASLRDPASQAELGRRFKFTPYAHNPTRGPLDPVVTLVEFNDLACGQCRAAVSASDAGYFKDSGWVRQVSIHLPLTRYSDTNVMAFYGKVAQRAGKYWEYRQKLLEVGEKAGAEEAFAALRSIGIEEAQTRRWLVREARRFYRELDADASLGRALGLDNPPHFYVNGIHVGERGIARDKASDVVGWLIARHRYKLDQPPLRGLPSGQ